jgi:hypothetical protein
MLVRGFKGFHKDLKCFGGYQYELGKVHYHTGTEPVKVRVSGFHFCEKLENVFYFYHFLDKDAIFCEVEGSGTIDTDGVKTAASVLHVVKKMNGTYYIGYPTGWGLKSVTFENGRTVSYSFGNGPRDKAVTYYMDSSLPTEQYFYKTAKAVAAAAVTTAAFSLLFWHNFIRE